MGREESYRRFTLTIMEYRGQESIEAIELIADVMDIYKDLSVCEKQAVAEWVNSMWGEKCHSKNVWCPPQQSERFCNKGRLLK